MKDIYISIINFYKDNKINYKKIEALIADHIKNKENKFYIKANNFNNNHLSSKERKKYYQKMVELMPAKTDFILELDFDSVNDYLEINSKLEKYDKEFKVLVKNPVVDSKEVISSYKEYLKIIESLSKKSSREICLDLDTEVIATYTEKELLEDLSKIKKLKTLVISPAYPYDLDIDQILRLKDSLNTKVEFLGEADDFYYLNLNNDFKTVSKYFNLLPKLYKSLKKEYAQNNLAKARSYQLKLNDFITFVNEIGESKCFDLLLSELLNFSLDSEKSLKKSERELLFEKFKEINQYKVDSG